MSELRIGKAILLDVFNPVFLTRVKEQTYAAMYLPQITENRDRVVYVHGLLYQCKFPYVLQPVRQVEPYFLYEKFQISMNDYLKLDSNVNYASMCLVQLSFGIYHLHYLNIFHNNINLNYIVLCSNNTFKLFGLSFSQNEVNDDIYMLAAAIVVYLSNNKYTYLTSYQQMEYIMNANEPIFVLLRYILYEKPKVEALIRYIKQNIDCSDVLTDEQKKYEKYDTW